MKKFKKPQAILLALFFVIYSSTTYAQDSGESQDCPCQYLAQSTQLCEGQIKDGDPPRTGDADCCVDGNEVDASDTCTPDTPGNSNGNSEENIGDGEPKNGFAHGTYPTDLGDVDMHLRVSVTLNNISAEISYEKKGARDCTSACGRAPSPPDGGDGGEIKFSGDIGVNIRGVRVSSRYTIKVPKKGPEMCDAEAVPFHKYCIQQYRYMIKPTKAEEAVYEGEIRYTCPQNPNHPLHNSSDSISGNSGESVTIDAKAKEKRIIVECCKHRCCNDS